MSNKEKKLGFIGKYLTKKIITIVVVIVAIGGISLGVKSFFYTDTKTTQLGFEDIGELATQEAYCSNVQLVDKSRKLFNKIDIPFTQSKYIYSYDCIIKAGLDFSSIDWSVDDEKKLITVKLPEIRILSNEIDLDSFKVYHESESIFTPVKLEESNNALKELKETAQKSAVDNGLLENAATNAKTIITSFYGQVYDLKEYQITFKN